MTMMRLDEKRVMADLTGRHRQTRLVMHQQSFLQTTGVAEGTIVWIEGFDEKMLQMMKFLLLSDFVLGVSLTRLRLGVRHPALSRMVIGKGGLLLVYDRFS